MSAPAEPAAGFGDAVLAAAAGAPGCLVVAAPEDPVAGEIRARAPEFLVPVAGEAVRAAVAVGAALAGRRVTVLLGGGDVPARLPVTDLPDGGGIVAVTTEARVAGACWGAGWTLVQPAWPADVPALLAGALAAGVPAVLRLPAPALAGGARPGGPPAGPPPVVGVPRVLREGTSGLVAASGAAAVGLLAEAARMLAERGVAVQALDLHTAAPGEGPHPAASDRVLLVGDRAVDAAAHTRGRWPDGLRAVPVTGDPRAAMEAVAARLRARR